MTTRLITMSAAAALCMGAFAAEEANEEKGEGWAWAPGEGVTFDETPIVSTEVSLAFDSKYLSYGFVDNNEPILTPAGSMTFFDWVTIGVSAIFDTTKYGHGADYTSRMFQYTELHPTVTIEHSFSPEDFEWLPTTVDIAVGWDYEYHPGSKAKGVTPWDSSISEDTQFWTVEIGLPDLWIEPKFFFEQDVVRDKGTYYNIELGHTFNLLDEEDDTLTLRPSVAQGFGNSRRIGAYAEKEDGEPLNHAGLMDSLLKLELAWNVCDGVSFSLYGAYSDFLFDRRIREASRRYEATGNWERSWNFIGGAAVMLSF